MTGKNNADIRMVVDAMEVVISKEHIDTFALVTGDSDFTPLVAKLRDANGLKTDQIKVGQKLKVPAGGAKKPSEPSASAAPAPKADVVPALPPSLPPLGEPAPKPPGQ